MSTPADASRRERLHAWWRRLALKLVRYELQFADERPAGERTCFVLETQRVEYRWVLEDVCERESWSGPVDLGAKGAAALANRVWTLRRAPRWFGRRAPPRDVAELEPLLTRARAGTPVEFVPVAIFWGRAPAREKSWLKLLLSETWGVTGRIRRMLAVLTHGRDVFVKVGRPIRAADVFDDETEPGGDEEVAARRLARLMRVYFQQQRTATVGPDLSHRRLLLEEVLTSAPVVEAVRREVRAGTSGGEARVRARARRYAKEIAADYSYPVVRVLDRLFGWVWNRLYEGIDVRHLDGLAALPPDSEIVYVPCHRSHVDYMLLSYVIYRHGRPPPHIAAGVNLNLPVVGSILRRGGAFFIRRSFQNNALYTAVFRGYLRAILAKGFPVKYFIEGTRSRTGRLLPPKLGLLAMTIQAYVADRERPIVFVPVYIGYEKLVEGQTYVRELAGYRKRKESLAGFVRSLGALRSRFGRVQLSLGEPIALDALLDEVHPAWQDETPVEPFRPPWATAAAERLAGRIMTSINEAAALNAVNLTALVVLAMPKQTIVEVELEQQLELYLELSRCAPYADRTGACTLGAREIIAQCEALGWLGRRRDALGDVLEMDERTAVLATYYRNNVVHVFALPALVAALFNNRTTLEKPRIDALLGQLYPCLRTELFLRLAPEELPEAADRQLGALSELGLLRPDGTKWLRPDGSTLEAAQLKLTAEIVQPFLERYYLGAAVLQRGEALRRREFVRRCSDAAERLSMIYSLNSPDLFNSALFDNLAAHFASAGIVEHKPGAALAVDRERLDEFAASVGFVLRPQLRRTLSNLAGLAAGRRSGTDAG